MVLNSTLYKWLNYAVENAICGADFMFRLFFDFSLKLSFKNHHKPPFHHIGADGIKPMKYIYIISYF